MKSKDRVYFGRMIHYALKSEIKHRWSVVDLKDFTEHSFKTLKEAKAYIKKEREKNEPRKET